MKKLLCIDGNSILNRAFFGIRLLTNKDGFPTNALYGMVNIIAKQMDALKPDYAAIAYDLHTPTFRHKMYGAYKAGRHAMPEELRLQMPVSREFADMMGLHILSMEGFEADDILGTLARMAEEDPEECTAYLLTGDKDSLQLISSRVHVLLAGNTETADMDEAAFLTRYGIPSDRFVDVKALMGDASDNIPGVPGIGEKGALKLISEFGSLDGVYDALPTARHTPSTRRKLEEGRESAYLSQTLSRICREVPLGISLDDICTKPFDRTAALRLFTQYGLSAFIKRYGLVSAASAVPQAVPASQEQSTYLTTGTQIIEFQTVDIHTDESTESPTAIPSKEFSFTSADAAGQSHVAWALAADGEGNTVRVLMSGETRTLPASDPSTQAFLDDTSNHFICYDCKTVYKELDSMGLHFRRCDFDVMLAAWVVSAGESDYSLDHLSLTWLSRLPAEGEDILPTVAALYPLLDARLRETQQYRVFAKIEMPLAAVLCDMELTGFKIDLCAVSTYGQKLDTLISEMQERIYVQAGTEFNINSPKQLGEVLFDRLLLPVSKKTKTGYSTSAEVLEGLRRYNPIIDDILDFRQYSKLRSTYVEGLTKVADEAGCIHTTFKQTGTVTGRLSSAEPNLQNIPIRTELGREMRKFFIPSEPGRVLIDADYSQIELRLLADIAGDIAMRDAFVRGFDIHTDTASRIFGVTSECVTVEMRKKAKAINFGLMYGMGEFSLAEDLHISRFEAKRYIDSYMHSYPDIEKYLSDIIRIAYEQGYVTTKYGRRRMIPELLESNKMRKKFGERVAMNSPIQGTAADIIKLAMIRVHDRLAASSLDCRMILQVHDELILDCAEGCAEEALQFLKTEMESAAALSVPLLVDAHIGQNWFEAH